MRLEIPARRQEEPWSCLAACLRMCLAYAEREVSEFRLTTLCGSSPIGTSLDQALAALPRLRLGGWIQERPDLEWLYDQLGIGNPVIVSFWSDQAGERRICHAVLVSGAELGRIFFMDPATGQEESLPEADFFSRWELSDGRALAVHIL